MKKVATVGLVLATLPGVAEAQDALEQATMGVYTTVHPIRASGAHAEVATRA